LFADYSNVRLEIIMKTRDIVVLLTTAVALLVAAGLTHAFQLWSFLGNYTVPWFCGALAIALLLVTLTAALTGYTPGTIPRVCMLTVLIGASVVVGTGMVVDALSYGVPQDWAGSIGEWIGFTTMLVAMFCIPRLNQKQSSEQ